MPTFKVRVREVCTYSVEFLVEADDESAVRDMVEDGQLSERLSQELEHVDYTLLDGPNEVPMCGMDCPGWAIFNAPEDPHIDRCDECEKFPNDGSVNNLPEALAALAAALEAKIP